MIGNKTKKTSFMVLGTIPKLVELMMQDNCYTDFIIESAAVLGSFARGKFICNLQSGILGLRQ